MKSVDTSSNALKSIPQNYSSHSISNNYFYTNRGGMFGNFLSNYMLFRMLTPSHRMYIDSYGATCYAPAYTGFRSVFPDIITLIVIIYILFIIITYIKYKRKMNRLH